MTAPGTCRCERPGGGLDDRREGERPWSPDTTDAPTGPPTTRQRAARDRAPTVTVRYVLVDGPDGQALAQRQTDALRQALIWLATHPDEDDPTTNNTTNRNRPRTRHKGKATR